MKFNFPLLITKPQLILFAGFTLWREIIHSPDRRLIGSGLKIANPSGLWKSAPDFPEWRYEYTGARIGNDLYFVGGLTLPSVYTISKKVNVYNILSKRWRQVCPYPKIIHHPAVVSTGSRLFVVGGNGLRITPYTYVYEYIIQKNTWERRSDMPTARGALGIAYHEGKIYAVGGSAWKRPLDSLESYDINSDTWKRMVPMPTSREHLAVVLVGNRIYVMGGYKRSLASCMKTHECFDIESGDWLKRSPLPIAISGFSAVSVGKSIYIFGGEQGWAVSGEVLEYRTDQNRWYRRADMPLARYASAAVVANDGIHVVGGNPYLLGYEFSVSHDIFQPGKRSK